MFASLGKAFANFFDGTLRGVVLKSVLITLGLFALLFVAVEYAVYALPTLGSHWANVTLEVLAPFLLLLLLVFLGAPVAAIFAALFLGQVAKRIETQAYPSVASSPGATLFESIGAGARLAALIVLVNAALIPLDVELPAVAEVATILANGWLLGREYFELAALRHLSRAAAEALRRRHGGALFAGGTIISLLTMVPIVNLFAPLFGAAFMVHMVQRFAQEKTV